MAEGEGPTGRTGRLAGGEPALYLATALLSLLLLVPVLRIDKADLRVPLAGYGDATFYQAIVIKPLITQPWYVTNPELGAPFALELQDYPTGTDSLHYLVLKVLAMVTRDSAIALNLFYLLCFPAIAVSMLWAARTLGLRRSTSVAVALLFTYLPYHLLRGEGHLVLSAYFMLPVGLVIAMRLDEMLPLPERGRGVAGWLGAHLGKPFLLLCLVAAVFALTGVYYAFFFIVMLVVLGVRAALRDHEWRRIVAPVALSLVVVAVAWASNLPTVLYQRENGPNLASTTRTYEDAEFYSLRPMQLILPNAGHAIPSWRRTAREYEGLLHNINPLLVNESKTSSLGVLGSVGFLLLLGWSLLRVADPAAGAFGWRRMGDLATVNLVMLFLGIVGGLGFAIAFLVTPMLRGYTRASIAIAMVSLLAFGAALDRVMDRWRGMPRWLPALVAVVLVGAGIVDQTSRLWVPDYDRAKAVTSSHRAFAAEADRLLADGAMVFQLPFVSFPGNDRPLPEGFTEYDLLYPYQYSSHLRWSFPAMRGREASDWQREVADLPAPEMLARLRKAGFEGLYVDLNGYEDEGRRIVRELDDEIGAPILVSPDGRMLLWRLKKR